MWKIWRIMKEYVENMKKYVNILDLSLTYLYGPWDLEKFRAPPLYSLWGLEKFRILPLHMGLGTWKHSMPELPPGLWDLEKFLSSSLHLHIYTEMASGTLKNSELCLYTGSGIWKNVELPLPSITVCWRGFTLPSPPYKLRTLPVNLQQ